MELLPDKYTPASYSLLAAMEALLTVIQAEGACSVAHLWVQVRHRPAVGTYDRFTAALTALYSVKLIDWHQPKEPI